MKELSIEEKAKAYDEAIKRAKDINRENSERGFKPSEDVLYIFSELKESEDERIRKELINFIKQEANSATLNANRLKFKSMLAWLEKQGEQKPIRHVWKYKKDHTPLLRDSFILNKYGCVAKSPSGALVSDVWVLDFGELAKLPKEEFERQGEQKPADKVEPKFKVGDWVIDKQDIVHQIANVVENVTNHTYGYDTVDGGYFNDNTEGVRFWTIQDAKDGDVLATDDGGICVFDGTIEEGKYPFAHCGLTRYGFETYDGKLPFTHDDVHPATKEQRDLLFTKMKEDGYEWDVYNKVLRKIEQKPQIELPKGEDYAIDGLWQAIQILEHSLGEVDGWQSDDGILEHKCAIEAVKRLYEHKSAWSEEDEVMLGNALWACKEKYSSTETYNWLKSLKERMKK